MKSLFRPFAIALALFLSFSCVKDVTREYSLSYDTECSKAGSGALILKSDVTVFPLCDGFAYTIGEGYSSFSFSVVDGADVVSVEKTVEGYCRIVPKGNGTANVLFELFDKDGVKRIMEKVSFEVRLSFLTIDVEEAQVSCAMYYDEASGGYNLVCTNNGVQITPSFEFKNGFLLGLIIPDTCLGRTLQFGKDDFTGKGCAFSLSEEIEDGCGNISADYFTDGTLRVDYDESTGLFELDLNASRNSRGLKLTISAYPEILSGFIWIGGEN